MPIVIIEQDGIRRGYVLDPRTVIGRWPSNNIVIEDAAVSRVHAWITERDDGCFLTDAQSRTGTKVNGKAVTMRHRLKPGDEIGIGPCKLIFQMDSGLPEGIEAIHRPGGSDTGFPGTGILFDCHCGAPLWAPVKLAGHARRCHYCRSAITIPSQSGVIAELRQPTSSAAIHVAGAAGAAGAVTCSICQWQIDAGHETAECPTCGLVFHKECWTENLGCSSYGCPEVNSLASPDSASPAAPGDPAGDLAFDEPADGEGHRMSWDSVLLTSSIAASLVGMLAFGVPALIVGIASVVYHYRAQARSASLAIASAVSLAGIAAGLAASYWWWM